MNIRKKILNDYGIDISQENILNFYKVNVPDISFEILEKKILDVHKKLELCIDEDNEKDIEINNIQPSKSDKYEAILKDNNLRMAVYKYNLKSKKIMLNYYDSKSASIKFAKKFFKLVKNTKEIQTSDIEFFFKYYLSEIDNKNAILQMLRKDLKVKGVGKERKHNVQTKKTNNSNPMIVNLFKEDTVLKIKRASEKFEEITKSEELLMQYPNICDGFFEFLDIKNIENAKEFSDVMKAKAKDAYEAKQEKGTEYIPLIELFNILQNLGNNKDVIDNFVEFKLLLKYPKLTPYMFLCGDMKPKSINQLYNIAIRYYDFDNEQDFLANYYRLIYDNFAINNNNRIYFLLKRINRDTIKNEYPINNNEIVGVNKENQILSTKVKFIHGLIYWPVYTIYFVFELIKAIFTEFYLFVIPVFLVLMILENWIFSQIGFVNLLSLKYLFFKEKWFAFLNYFMGTAGNNLAETILLSLVVINALLVICVVPPYFVSLIISKFSYDFKKQFDWIGIERTFQQFFENLIKKTESQYLSQGKLFFKDSLGKIILNLLCLIILSLLVVFVPIFVKKWLGI